MVLRLIPRLLCAVALPCLLMLAPVVSGAQPRITPEAAALENAKSAAGDVVVVAVGDISCPPSRAQTARTCRQADTGRLAGQLDPDAVLGLGDLQYEKGELKNFRNSYAEAWGALKSVTYPVPGNHEYYSAGASGYYKYFANRQDGSPGYYARKLGSWTIYGLNSTCEKINCARQYEWLRAELKQDTGCSLFFMHYPRYSSGQHGSSLQMKKFFRIAYRHRVELFLSGHDHHYERFAPQNAAGLLRKGKGTVQIVSGAGGKTHYAAKRNVDNSRAAVDDVFGVTRLVLSESSWSASFRGIDNRTYDPSSRRCR